MTEDPQKTPAPASTSDLDREKILEEAAEKAALRAEEIASEKMQEVEEKAAQRAREEILQKLSGNEPIPEDAPAWVKRGEKAPKSWDEVLQEAEIRAERRLTEREKAKLAEETKKKQEEDAQKTRTTEEWNKIWDAQLDDLEKQGKLPEVPKEIKEKIAKNEALTEDERNNPALLERFELQKVALEKQETNLKVAYYEHYNNRSRDIPTAPVFGVTRSASSTPRAEYSYEEIHRTASYEDLLEELAKK